MGFLLISWCYNVLQHAVNVNNRVGWDHSYVPLPYQSFMSHYGGGRGCKIFAEVEEQGMVKFLVYPLLGGMCENDIISNVLCPTLWYT